jgi:transcriptional regulator with XRE-family HTH domain
MRVRNRSAEGFSGPLLLVARKQCGLTQEGLAALSNMTSQYVRAMERGRKTPSPIALRDLATALMIDPMQLLVVVNTPSLIQLRCCAGLSQREVAEKIGRSDMSYSRLERGETTHAADGIVENLALAFGVEPQLIRAAYGESENSIPQCPVDTGSGK